MNVLSLFDGMSCGRIALERAGIKVDNYFASEIDKYAIKVSEANYPDIIRLGDVTGWRSWKLPKIDLLIGGSPCQGFSFAGKQLNFEDPRSKLFFEFYDIGRYFKPKKVLLENVKMKQEYQDVISKYIGVDPMKINSALVSAQNRERLYWFNWDVEQPEDKGILLKDVLEFGTNIVYQRARGKNPGGVRTDKAPCMTPSRWEENVKKLQLSEKALKLLYDSVTARGDVFQEGMVYSSWQKHYTKSKSKSPALTSAMGMGGGHVPMFVDLLHSPKTLAYMDRTVKGGRTHWDFKHHSDINDPKSAAVVANFFNGVPYNVLKDWDCIRKFHPVECERLQTVPDDYTNHVSNTQRYKMLGNGWTVDVITHIFRGING